MFIMRVQKENDQYNRNIEKQAELVVPMYVMNLNAEELIDQINPIDTYFEYENVVEEKNM